MKEGEKMGSTGSSTVGKSLQSYIQGQNPEDGVKTLLLTYYLTRLDGSCQFEAYCGH